MDPSGTSPKPDDATSDSRSKAPDSRSTATGSRGAGEDRGSGAPRDPSSTSPSQSPPTNPEAPSGANASPIPGKDERRNRSI